MVRAGFRVRFFIYIFEGLQRFGKSTVGTHEVGIALLREQYEKAVNLILATRPEGKGR